MRTRVKICGITRPQDGVAAADLGADAIGVVFYEGSSRAVDIEQALAIRRALPPFVTLVGLFVNATEERLREVLEAVEIDLLQFHGDESPEECGRYGRSYLKAIHMAHGVDVNSSMAGYSDAAGFLLDTHDPLLPGGSGRAFDWSLVPRDLPGPVILAGGLTSANVVAAIRAVRPYGVDVSSGVEVARGIKDEALIAEFMSGVEDANKNC